MSEELNVNENTENLDEELDLELEPEEVPQTGETEADKDKRIADLERKNKQLFARLKKPKQSTTPNSKPTEELQEIREAVNKLSLAEQKRQFQYENNLSPEETDKVFAINPKPTKELLNDPFVKGGLESIRAARRVSEATPSPSGRSTTHNGKTFKDMTPDERQAAMEARFKR